jgi:hypothetical protein
MRVVALNVRHGGRGPVQAIVSALAACGPDVVVLSEFDATLVGDELLAGLASLGLSHHGAGGSAAPFPNTVAIASRHPMTRGSRAAAICLPSTAPERYSLQARELCCNRFAGEVLVPEGPLRAMDLVQR